MDLRLVARVVILLKIEFNFFSQLGFSCIEKGMFNETFNKIFRKDKE